jgi:hypothetical protein
VCGIPGLGSCFISHQKASCADPTCCELVCGFDPFCCEAVWDLFCAQEAQDSCVLPPPKNCGDSTAGSCLVPHGNSSCSDATCCQTVCAGLPNCCTVIWDDYCVYVAQSACNATCLLPCPSNAIPENEACGSRTNDPAIRPGPGPNAPQVIGLQTTVCGTLYATNSGTPVVDVDVYSIDLRNADTDHDGAVKVAITLASAKPAFAALTPENASENSLPGALLRVNAAGCASTRDWTCVPPAKYWLVIAPGSNGVISNQALACADGAYWFTLETSGVCALPCTNATGSCFSPHATPSCVDPACCGLVCASIPSCCETAWDETCAVHAALACGAPAPSNDNCATPMNLTTGSTAVSLLGSTASPPAFACAANQTASGGDVWFRWQAPALTHGAYQIDVCGVTFDSRLDVFKGSCGALSLQACSDNSSFCNPTYGSRLTLNTECGQTYLIRLASLQGATGFATINIAPLSAQQNCCLGDIDGSGEVDSADLGLLLLYYGPCPNCAADLDGSGEVDSADLGLLLLYYGPCS